MAELWAAKVSDQYSPPTNVRVYCCDPALYAALRDGIVSRLPRARVEKARADECPDGYHDGRPADGEARLLLDAKETQIVLPDDPRGRRGRTPEPGGTLTLTARGAADVAVTTSFVEKPWLADFALFTHQRPGRWVVGRSDPLRPAMSPAEAADAARRAAAKELFPVVRARVQRAGRSSPPDDWIRRQLDAKLAGGRLVVDRFPQRFQRPGYDTWREAVLVDASDRELDRLVGDIHAERFQERQSWVKTVASVGGLLLVIYTLYRLANAFTRGYFVWSLRTAAAVAATAVVVIISMIA